MLNLGTYNIPLIKHFELFIIVIINLHPSHFNIFRLYVHVYYDESFYRRFGNGAVTRIRALLSIVKTIYSDPTLTLVIEPQIVNISYIRGSEWEASEAILR